MRAVLTAVLVAALPGAAHPREVLGHLVPENTAPYRTVRVVWEKQLVDWELLVYAPRSLSAPAVDDFSGDVIVGTRDGRVRALTESGKELWSVRMAEPTSPPALTEERIVIGATDGKVHA